MMTFFQLQELQSLEADDASLEYIAIYHEQYIIGRKYKEVSSLD